MPIEINREAQKSCAAREQIPKRERLRLANRDFFQGKLCALMMKLAVVAVICTPHLANAQDEAFDALLREEILASDPSVSKYEELNLPKPQPLNSAPRNSDPIPLVDILDAEDAPTRNSKSSGRRTRARAVAIEPPTGPRQGAAKPLSRLESLRRRMNASERVEEENVQRIDGKIIRLRKLMAEKRKRAETKSISLQSEMPAKLPTPASPSDDRPAFDSILSEAIAITDKPVDRIALANNLFASGELALAQKMYESIELKEVSEAQKVWIQYQMAGCLRRLDNSQEAQSLYRTVAASKVAPHWAKRARWWLNTMSSSARIKERQVKMVNTLVQLKEATDELLTDEDK